MGANVHKTAIAAEESLMVLAFHYICSIVYAAYCKVWYL